MRWFWEKKLDTDFIENYKNIQIDLNKKKFKTTWVDESEIKTISTYLKENEIEVKRGICHGSRNGNEVRYFKKHLKSNNILGTDISPTANNVEDLIQWDFHDKNDEWKSQFDFMYTNSFDHTYDPYKCIDAWSESLTDNGVGIIHFNPISMTKSDAQKDGAGDCFSATESEIIQIVKEKAIYIETIQLLKDNKNDRKAIIFKRR